MHFDRGGQDAGPSSMYGKGRVSIEKRGSPSGGLRSVDPGSLFTRQSCILGGVVSKGVRRLRWG